LAVAPLRRSTRVRLLRVVGGSRERRRDTAFHLVLMEWLGQDADGPGGEQLGSQRCTGSCRHEYDGDVVSGQCQAMEQDFGGVAPAMDIADDASNIMEMFKNQKLVRRAKLLCCEIQRFDEAPHSVSNKDVIVYNRYDNLIHINGVPAAREMMFIRVASFHCAEVALIGTNPRLPDRSTIPWYRRGAPG
jgi:hypothetical protein